MEVDSMETWQQGQNGKGSERRPSFIPFDVWDENYRKVFNG